MGKARVLGPFDSTVRDFLDRVESEMETLGNAVRELEARIAAGRAALASLENECGDLKYRISKLLRARKFIIEAWGDDDALSGEVTS